MRRATGRGRVECRGGQDREELRKRCRARTARQRVSPFYQSMLRTQSGPRPSCVAVCVAATITLARCTTCRDHHLAGGLAAALVFGWLTQRLGLSTLVGYMLAGILVGPYTPGFVADANLASQMAEIGVILLMFGVGMHFHPQELLRVWRIAVPGAIAQSAVATLAGWACARAFGWSNAAGFVFGMALAVASTVVLMRMLVDQDRLTTRAGHVAVGWLIVEDLFTVVALVVLPVLAIDAAGLASFGMPSRSRWARPRRSRAGLVRRQPRGFAGAGTHGENAFGGAVHADRVRGGARHRGARGAGLPRVGGAGRVLRGPGGRPVALRPAGVGLHDAIPRRLLGTVLRVGRHALQSRLRARASAHGARRAGDRADREAPRRARDRRIDPRRRGTAATVAVGLAQIGEFSFILATLGKSLGVLPAEGLDALVVAAIISIALNPVLFRVLGKYGTRGAEATAAQQPPTEVAAGSPRRSTRTGWSRSPAPASSREGSSRAAPARASGSLRSPRTWRHSTTIVNWARRSCTGMPAARTCCAPRISTGPAPSS